MAKKEHRRVARHEGTRRRNITVTLLPELVDKLDQLAAKKDMSRSALIESLISDRMESVQAEAMFMQNDVVRNAFFEAMTSPGVIAEMMKATGEGEVDPDEVASLLRDAKKKKRK